MSRDGVDFKALVARVQERLLAGKPVRERVPGGRIHIDRPLPVLTVHRFDGRDRATPRVVTAQGSYLILDAGLSPDSIEGLISGIVEPLADRFGTFMLVETWAGGGEADKPWPLPTPSFKILAADQEGEAPEPVGVFRATLPEIEALGREIEVEVEITERIAPPGCAPLLGEDARRELGCLLIGLELPTDHRDSDTGRPYPAVARELGRDLAHVLQRVVYDFSQVHTSYEPDDYRVLGRRIVLETGWKIDEALAAIAERSDFLLNVTPVNAEAAWEDFRKSGYRKEPRFHYRPLTIDPDLVKRELYDLEIERVEDPTLTYLLREKRIELDVRVSMLEVRDRPEFLLASQRVYGDVDDDLLELAENIMATTSPDDDGEDPRVDAASFAAAAEAEIDRYRATHPEVRSEVQVRADIPGVLVSRGNLLVGEDLLVTPGRAEALIQHEIGTHVVTYENGLAQPLRLLAAGLPGYEETQEGLALFAEYLVGGLDADRLRRIAARAIAIRRLLDGAGFVEVFMELNDRSGLGPRAAWTTTMRTFRAGGLTKDAMYLRGLVLLLRHLTEGGSLERLLVGKLAVEHSGLIEELLWRKVIRPMSIRPHWMDAPGAEERLERAREGATVIELLAERENV